jgi:TP901-1 family phage major tail protein
MAKIKGIDVLIKIGSSAVGGQRGATLNRSGEAIDVTTKDSSGWKESEAGLKEWGVDCDGLVVVDDTAYAALEAAYMASTEVTVEVAMPSGKKYSGSGIITDFPIEAPYDDEVSYSVSILGNGELTQEEAV